MNQVNENGGGQQPSEAIRIIHRPFHSHTTSITTTNQESTYKTLLSQFLNLQNVIEHLSPHISSQDYIYKQSYQSLLSEQNYSVLLNPHNSPEAHQVKSLNYQLNKKDADLAYFWPLWNSHPQKFIRNIEFIIQKQNWDLYRYDFERAFELFLSIYERKLSKAPFLRQLYPGLQQLVEKIAKVIQYDPNKLRLHFEEGHTMIFYEYYLREMQSRNKLQGAFYIQDEQKQTNMLIGEVIAQSPLFQGNHPWADIFLRAGIFKRVQLDKQPYVDRDLQQESRKSKQNRQILKRRLNQLEDVLPPEDRPCCTQYFYFNYRIYDQTICNCHLLTQRKFKALWENALTKQQTPQKSQKSEPQKNEKSQKALQQKQQKQKQSAELLGTLRDICGLLNSGGGVILFNVFRNYLQMWPRGELIGKSKFQAARQLFADKLQCIHPSAELDKQIFISFVPVVKNPITEGLAESGKKKYIQGLYVMRIVVRPREQSAPYIYFIPNDNESFQVPTIENGASKALPLRQAIKFIKKKFAYYYIPETDYADEQELAMLRGAYSLFQDHDVCLKPDRGLPLAARAAPQEKVDLQKIQSEFKYLTLLVAQRPYHGVIAQKLRSKGIDCEIVIRYDQYKLRAGNNSAALFHNKRFDDLLSEVKYKEEYKFNGKSVLTILVTPFIKLLDRNKHKPMPLQDLKSLQTWLKAEHPNESLTLWRYEQSNENHEFYLQTGSKMSTLFIYYVMNHHGEKCSLKNPKGYERMAEHERNAKMTIFYPVQPPEAQTTTERR